MATDKRVTIADIARMAGVSAGAVSFALNGRPGLSDATRERILTIVRETQWQPSSAARALVVSRAGSVGLALARPARAVGAEAFFTHLIAGIESKLSEATLGLQLRLVKDIDEEVDALRQWFGANQVDGVILIDPRENDPRQAYLASIDARSVVVGSRPEHGGTSATVWIDDGEVATTLFEYIIALGHTHIVHVSGPLAFEHVHMRASVLGHLGGDTVITETVETDFSVEQATRVTRRLLSGKKRPTAIVYDNDVMAVAGLRVAQEMGLSVPRDVSLASFDDSVVAELVTPAITAMTRDPFELGERAAMLLREQMAAGRALPSVSGPTPTLSVRESTAPPGRP